MASTISKARYWYVLVLAAFGLTGWFAPSALADTTYPITSETAVTSGPGAGGTVYTWGDGSFRRVPPAGFNFAEATPAQLKWYGIVPTMPDLSELKIAAPTGPLVSVTPSTLGVRSPDPGNSGISPDTGTWTPETSYGWSGPQPISSGAWAVTSQYTELKPVATPYSTSDICRSWPTESDSQWAGMGEGESDSDQLVQTGTYSAWQSNGQGYQGAQFWAEWPSAFVINTTQKVATDSQIVDASVLDWGVGSTNRRRVDGV